jgi:hypothetical protein
MGLIWTRMWGMLDLWREARGKVMRTRWDELMQHFECVEGEARDACLDYIKSRFDPLSMRYTNSSSAERKRIFQYTARLSQQLADSGHWPSALGLRIMTINLIVRDLPGSDAAFVRQASDSLIDESRRPPGHVMPLPSNKSAPESHNSSPLSHGLPGLNTWSVSASD